MRYVSSELRRRLSSLSALAARLVGPLQVSEVVEGTRTAVLRTPYSQEREEGAGGCIIEIKL
jgi:hypothetical protein